MLTENFDDFETQIQCEEVFLEDDPRMFPGEPLDDVFDAIEETQAQERRTREELFGDYDFNARENEIEHDRLAHEQTINPNFGMTNEQLQQAADAENKYFLGETPLGERYDLTDEIPTE